MYIIQIWLFSKLLPPLFGHPHLLVFQKKFHPPLLRSPFSWNRRVVWKYHLGGSKSFLPITSKHHYVPSYFFGKEVVLMVFFEKDILYILGKILISKIWSKFSQFWSKLTTLRDFGICISRIAINPSTLFQSL